MLESRGRVQIPAEAMLAAENAAHARLLEDGELEDNFEASRRVARAAVEAAIDALELKEYVETRYERLPDPLLHRQFRSPWLPVASGSAEG